MSEGHLRKDDAIYHSELTETEAFLQLWIYFKPYSNPGYYYLIQGIII